MHFAPLSVRFYGGRNLLQAQASKLSMDFLSEDTLVLHCNTTKSSSYIEKENYGDKCGGCYVEIVPLDIQGHINNSINIFIRFVMA